MFVFSPHLTNPRGEARRVSGGIWLVISAGVGVGHAWERDQSPLQRDTEVKSRPRNVSPVQTGPKPFDLGEATVSQPLHDPDILAQHLDYLPGHLGKDLGEGVREYGPHLSP